jgi:hypothetical protein
MIPPILQALGSLDDVFGKAVSFRGNKLLCAAEDSLAFG